MNRILFSTGAVIGRPNNRDITLLGECVNRLDCDGIEFLMYDSWYGKIDKIKESLSHFPLPVPVFHADKKIGDLISRNDSGDSENALELFAKNCALANDLGSEKIVLHLWNGILSDKNIDHNIEFYKPLREIADSYDLSLMIENVVCNKADPMTHLLTLSNIYPDIQFTFDTKMAAFHGQLEQLYKNEKLFKSIGHFHINDYGGGYMEWERLSTLHPGKGNIDFEKLFRFLKNMNYQGDYTIEATSFDKNGIIDFDTLNESLKKIRAYLDQ